MIAELGLYFLCLGLGFMVLQLYSATQMLTSSQIHLSTLNQKTYFYFFSIVMTMLCLGYAFVTNDFSVNYVAAQSNSHLPIPYKIAAIWGGHEGSLLLWLFIFSGWFIAFNTTSQKWPPALFIRIFIVLSLITLSFLIFILFTSNPFVREVIHTPLEGRDLNPLLQDPGLVSHPPMLYMGYVGTSINYAIAVAILWYGEYSPLFARLMRPWALACFCFLTLGIVLGSLWAYRELGWGGFWFWDPVENASFIPWLISVALVHSLIVTEKRDLFKNGSLLLCILLFALSLLGTFLVRSGVITSVHAFANDPARGIFLLSLLAFILIGALVLYTYRAPKFSSPIHLQFLSKEFFLLTNNIILIIGGATVLLGTIYPMILDSLHLEKISVGPQYFNTVLGPFVFLLMILMGIVPFSYWNSNNAQRFKSLIFYNSLLILLIVLTTFSALPSLPIPFILSLTSSFWLLSGTCSFFIEKISSISIEDNGFKKFFALPWGMILGHTGLALTMIGIGFSSYFSQEKEVALKLGESLTLSGYHFTLKQLSNDIGPNYFSNTALFSISHDHIQPTFLLAEKRYYTASKMVLTETAIDAGLFKDVYIAMGEKLDEKTWSFRIYIKLMIRFIWLGGFIMFLGGLFSIRQNLKKSKPYQDKIYV